MKLIPFDALKTMFTRACACKFCGSPVTLRQETFGLATNLYLTCIPRDNCFAKHQYKVSGDEIGTGNPAGPPDDGSSASVVARDSAKKYLINILAVLAMQQLGLGMDGMMTLLGTLGIRSSMGCRATWRTIQDRVGVAEQEVKYQVLAKNRARAISFALADGAKRDADGHVGLICSIDGAWQKRSSGRQYDSPSGHNILVDCRTKLILDVIVYSKLCAVCDRKMKKKTTSNDGDDKMDIDDDDDDDEDDDDAEKNADNDDDDDQQPAIKAHRCPKNFIGSSKSMESVGAVELVQRAYRTGKYWVETVVGDDDSTSRSALKIDLRQYQLDHPDVPKDSYWPKRPNKDGKMVYVPNKGKLHWSVKGPTSFLCDPTHRTRIVGNHMFALAAATAKTDVTKADALRIKRNLGYAHKQARSKLFEEYRTAIRGALLHLGNDHSCCDAEWCAFKAGKKDETKDNANYLRKGTKRWNNIQEVMDRYSTDEMLRMTHHAFDSQKNESLNTKTATVAPKTKTFCKTMSLADRISFVTIVDSIGYDAGISRILSNLAGGKPVVIPPELQLWMRRMDAMQKRKKEYQQLPATKKKRAAQVKEQTKQAIADDKKARKRGLDYGSGIAVESDKKQEEAAVGRKQKADDSVCPRCGEPGHSRVTSKKCRFNSDYLAGKRQKNEGHNKNTSVDGVLAE